MRAFALTVLALSCFAANSLLCRTALRGGEIDAVAFTVIRLASGAAVLAFFLLRPRARTAVSSVRAWSAAFALFAYAISFSLAYLKLTAGVGALLLFGMVQVTMIGTGIVRGERLRAAQWLGIAAASAGLLVLVAPGLSAPPPVAALLMAGAGASWGVYSLLGRGSAAPIPDTARNFVRCTPFAAALGLGALAFGHAFHATASGCLLAVTSGAVTSGGGYAIWYAALPSLPPARAAVVQLSVPIIAAVGGVMLLREPASPRLALAAVLVVGGIFLTVAARQSVTGPR